MLNVMRTAIGIETLNSEEMTEESKNPDENIDEMEEGELPEEGEICDDEDTKDVAMAEPGGPAPPTPASVPSTASLAVRKPRDFDREEVASVRGREGDAINSWKNIMSQRTKAGSIDANEEYYGYGKSSPIEVSGDKDYRPRNGDSGDKDYRWGAIREETSHRGTGQDLVNEYGDSDYRSSSPRLDRRRRRSPSPPYASKRGRGHSPPFRGGFRGRGFRSGHFERQICKFFREGYCRDGDKCAYSHDAADSHRKAELCKFYQQGFCKKNLHCNLLHGEYPCKAYHKGECTKDPCQFSHEPLNDFTRPIFEQMLKDDELASRIAIPQGPLKRRVLLPGGPSNTSPGHPGASPILIPSATASDGIQSGVVPPPSVVVPTLGTSSAAVTQPQLVLPPGMAVPRQPFSAFFPPHVITASGAAMIDPALLAASLPALPMPPPIDPAALAAVSAAQSAATAPSSTSQASQEAKKDDLIEDDDDGGFNVNKMLERITSKVKGLEENNDSPASPPMYNETEQENKEALTIPGNSTVTWKLHRLDDVPCTTSIDPAILQKSLNDSRLRNDPRIKKSLASQFDAFTNTLMTSSVPTAHPSGTVMQMTPAVGSQPNVSATGVGKEPVTSSAKPVDPRMANRDPRKRLASASDRRPTVPDPRLAAVGGKSFEPSKNSDQANGSMQNTYSGMTPTTSVGVDQLYTPAVPELVSQDRDHRLSPHYRTSPSRQNDRAFNDNRRGSYGNSWMPQLNSSQDLHNVGRPSVTNFGTDFGSQDRDERQLTNSVARPSSSASPPKSSENSAPLGSTGPVSLREKRKNNEYESPLSRLRWGP